LKNRVLIGAVAAFIIITFILHNSAGAANKAIPTPSVDETLSPAKGQKKIVFAGGCFWGIQTVFKHTKGVISSTAGYSGGEASTADYETVSEGSSGHAESVQVVYDPSQVTFGQLLKIFFSVAHDPTELNRQGPDRGTQYRSVIFFNDAEQKHIVESYIAQLESAHFFNNPIVTQVVPLKAFYTAEAHHQDYAENHPYDPYIVFNDAPKLENLKKEYPELYVK